MPNLFTPKGKLLDPREIAQKQAKQEQMKEQADLITAICSVDEKIRSLGLPYKKISTLLKSLLDLYSSEAKDKSKIEDVTIVEDEGTTARRKKLLDEAADLLK